MKKQFQKVKTTLSLNGYDWHKFKEIAKIERTTPSVLVGQYINAYLRNRGGEASA
jgi:UDP-N-acetylmuramyl tripeptide synthase